MHRCTILSFDKCIYPCNQHLCQDIEHLHYPREYSHVSSSLFAIGEHSSDFCDHRLMGSAVEHSISGAIYSRCIHSLTCICSPFFYNLQGSIQMFEYTVHIFISLLMDIWVSSNFGL